MGELRPRCVYCGARATVHILHHSSGWDFDCCFYCLVADAIKEWDEIKDMSDRKRLVAAVAALTNNEKKRKLFFIRPLADDE